MDYVWQVIWHIYIPIHWSSQLGEKSQLRLQGAWAMQSMPRSLGPTHYCGLVLHIYIYIIYYLYWFRTPHFHSCHSFSFIFPIEIAMLWVAARYAPFSDTAILDSWFKGNTHISKSPSRWLSKTSQTLELIIPGKNIHILYQWYWYHMHIYNI